MSDTLSRRQYLRLPALAAATTMAEAAQDLPVTSHRGWPPALGEAVSLCGEWQFRLATPNQTWAGELPAFGSATGDWRSVVVPHTWQVEGQLAEYYGSAWYVREFDAPAAWRDTAVRVEFEAVFHSAWVWVNGKECGKHLGKGYTAFTFDIGALLRFGERNSITVRVDNGFSDAMLPRGRSSDWAHDGGIYRPVSLLVTPPVFVERVAIDAVPDLNSATAAINVTAYVANKGTTVTGLRCRCRVVDDETGLTSLEWSGPAGPAFPERSTVAVAMPAAVLREAKRWHFDHPHLYRLETELVAGNFVWHRHVETFGVRTFEIREGAFYLNGERIRPMGVERMAGSHPRYGMAEPEEWLRHDHQDMIELNGLFTRVHWPQDKRTLDFCDRHGILIQTEVPTWGPKTFADMQDEPTPAIMTNGLEQLREMVARDRNHPSIYAWGLCNEIGGQQPAAFRFAEKMYEEARALDPRRLRTYASNSLTKSPGNDATRLMDFVSWNEYYESWMGGTPADLRRNLEAIRDAFPGKPIVISEYGYCACTAERPEGDERRIQVLREHTAIFRDFPEVGGLIFFCYNDYRTHIGDRGLGVLKQRVHGVVDLLGNRKPSFAALREQASPVEALLVKGTPGRLQLTLRTRASVPSWPLRDYRLQWTVFGYGDFPAERNEMALPELAPGADFETEFACQTREPVRIVIEVLRPTGDSTRSVEWRP